MPELPDIDAYLCALDTRIVGKTLASVRVASPVVLRTAQPPIAEVQGQAVRELRRIGKRVAIGMNNDLWLVIHLMIAGRLHWRTAGARLLGRNNLAAFDFSDGSLVLTEAGTKRRASLHVVSGESALRALTDPRIVSGIGNAYSDEILHAAQLSPIALTHRLHPQEWKRLYSAARATLGFAARREESCWPIARYPACWEPIGRGPWTNSRRSRNCKLPCKWRTGRRPDCAGSDIHSFCPRKPCERSSSRSDSLNSSAPC